MSSKLKIEAGFNTVSKINRMFKDVEQSSDTHQKYKESKGDQKDIVINGITVTV